MKHVAGLLLALLPVLATGPRAKQDEPRFTSVELWVDSGSAALGAWQAKLVDPSGRAQVVGVEGGDDDAWRAAPYHDPQALQSGAIVIAAYSLDGGPTGRQRVARVHLAVTGAAPVDFELTLQAAADEDGEIEGASAELVR